MTTVAKETTLLARHSIIYGLGTVTNRIAAFFLLPIYTRFLSSHDYGIKELVGLSTDVIGILLSTAIASAIYRFYFEYEDLEEKQEVIGSALIGIAGMGIIVLFVLYLFARKISAVVLDSPELYYYFIVSFTSMCINSLNNVGLDYLRATYQSIKFVILSVGRLIVNIFLNIYFICFLKIGVLGILLSTLITSILAFCILVVPLSIKIKLRFSTEKLRKMIKFGLPLVPSQLGGFIVHLSDRFFIKGYCSIAEAGIYSLGYRLGAMPANFIAYPFNQAWQPRRFELYKDKDSEVVFGKVFTYFLGLMIFASLAVAGLSREILMIIADRQFWDAYKVVPLIALAITIFSFHYHFNIGILISKKTKYLAYINLSNAVLVITLNILLISNYGVYGAALATLISFVYKAALTYYFSQKYYRIHFEFGRIFKIFLTAGIIYLALCSVNLSNIYASFLLKLAVIGLFPFLIFITGFFTETEMVKIRQVIRTRSLDGLKI